MVPNALIKIETGIYAAPTVKGLKLMRVWIPDVVVTLSACHAGAFGLVLRSRIFRLERNKMFAFFVHT